LQKERGRKIYRKYEGKYMLRNGGERKSGKEIENRIRK
jgi:hypothetical protein